MPPRMKDVPIVESLEGSDEDAADVLPSNVEASNAAREAQVHGSPAGKGAGALEASLSSESAGVFTISLGVLHSHRYSKACTHARTQETSRTLALHSSDAKAMAMAQSTIAHY